MKDPIRRTGVFANQGPKKSQQKETDEPGDGSGRGTRHEELPIHRALVQRLLRSETAAGATVLRGIWGFYGDHKPHGDKLFQLARGVPVTTIE